MMAAAVIIIVVDSSGLTYHICLSREQTFTRYMTCWKNKKIPDSKKKKNMGVAEN
jgi:hypothetical protein